MFSPFCFQNIHMSNTENLLLKRHTKKKFQDKLKAGKQRNKHIHIYKRKNFPDSFTQYFYELFVVKVVSSLG